MEWYPLSKVLNALETRKWTWLQATPLKYLDIRVDTRDNKCLVFDRDKNLLAESWEEFQELMDKLNKDTEQCKFTTFQWYEKKINKD